MHESDAEGLVDFSSFVCEGPAPRDDDTRKRKGARDGDASDFNLSGVGSQSAVRRLKSSANLDKV